MNRKVFQFNVFNNMILYYEYNSIVSKFDLFDFIIIQKRILFYINFDDCCYFFYYIP